VKVDHTIGSAISILACALCLFGCGGNTSDNTPKAVDLTPFVGNWNYTGGTETASCLGQVFSTPATGTFLVTKRTENELTAQDSSTGCSYDLVVMGQTATGKVGESCAVSLQTLSGTAVIRQLTLQLDGDSTAHESGSFQLAGLVQGFNVSCDLTVEADLEKQGAL